MNLEKFIEVGLEFGCKSTDIVSEVIDPEFIKNMILEWNRVVQDQENWIKSSDLLTIGLKLRTASRIMKNEKPSLEFPEINSKIIEVLAKIPKKVGFWNWNKERKLRRYEFSEEEIERIKEFIKIKIGHIRSMKPLLRSEFEISLSLCKDFPDFSRRKHVNSGIFTFRVCREDHYTVTLKCINVYLD